MSTDSAPSSARAPKVEVSLSDAFADALRFGLLKPRTGERTPLSLVVRVLGCCASVGDAARGKGVLSKEALATLAAIKAGPKPTAVRPKRKTPDSEAEDASDGVEDTGLSAEEQTERFETSVRDLSTAAGGGVSVSVEPDTWPVVGGIHGRHTRFVEGLACHFEKDLRLHDFAARLVAARDYRVPVGTNETLVDGAAVFAETSLHLQGEFPVHSHFITYEGLRSTNDGPTEDQMKCAALGFSEPVHSSPSVSKAVYSMLTALRKACVSSATRNTLPMTIFEGRRAHRVVKRAREDGKP